MRLGEAVTTVFSKYAVFKGRASRSEYWWFQLFVGVLTLMLRFSNATYIRDNDHLIKHLPAHPAGLEALFELVILIPLLAVTVRRLHDTDRSGWYLPFLYIPFFVLFWFCAKGTLGKNRFGDDPTNANARIPLSVDLQSNKVYGPFSPIGESIAVGVLYFATFQAAIAISGPSAYQIWSVGRLALWDFVVLGIMFGFVLNFFRILLRLATKIQKKPRLALTPTGLAFYSGEILMAGDWSSLGPFEIEPPQPKSWRGSSRRQRRLATASITGPNISDYPRLEGALSIKTWELNADPDMLVSELNQRREQTLSGTDHIQR